MRNGHYAPIHLHRHGDRHIDRHKDREIGSGEQKRKNSSYLPICLGCLEFVSLSVRFGSLWLVSVVRLIGSDFLPSIKKFFNFPNFFLIT